MASSRRQSRRFIPAELVVALAVLAILVFLAVPFVSGMLLKGRLINSVSKTRFIHMAAMSMAADGVADKDPGLGWPGDLKANGRIATLSDYVSLLVRRGYFKPDELHSFFSDSGYKTYRGTLTSGSDGVLSPAFTDEYCAFKVFLVKDKDPSNTVFLETKNYAYDKDLSAPKAKPFGVNGFVVSRKGGDVSFYKQDQAHSLREIGDLPGGGTVESAANCLNPEPVAP
ncbi:MAG: hypothetical protein PHQ12_04010 [Chthoniobacteraceae bacterium]|nr:hypothetical protein [Chthoniobacteraceae bacterium]